MHHDLCCLVDDDARASLIFGAAATLAVAAQSAVCHIDTSSSIKVEEFRDKEGISYLATILR